MSRTSQVLLIVLLVLIIYTVHLVAHMTNMSMTVSRRSQEEDSEQLMIVDVFPHGGLSYRRTASIVSTCVQAMTAVVVVLAVSLIWPWGKK